ncbi:Cilia- and flagella-associated protein 20 [Folsomia candida]|uniref:Cilia-and flagella-associated protein 20 n=1 Tax=Folsomia candida TaxID=158441 RepID=A0A226EI36_FOLCA|nr:Cilia- and flagella-associated protein 20 [Folsomia candida]
MDYSGNLRVAPDTPTSLFGGHIQTGVINLLHCTQEKVLEHWEKQVRRGYVKKVQDIQLNGPVIEIVGQNPNTVFITTPIGLYQSLGIRLPILVLVVKNLRKQFTFDILVLDDKNVRHHYKFSNRQTTTRIKATCSYIPLRMEDGWNMLQINLQDVVFKTFGSNYKECIRLQINANCRLRRVGFGESSPDQEQSELPADLRAFVAETRGITSDI